MERPHVNQGRLEWSGEHWVNDLNDPDTGKRAGRVSLFHTRFSPVGEGTVAVVDIPGEAGFTGICVDNRRLVDHLSSFMRKPLDFQDNVAEANFTKSGHIGENPSWSMETDDLRIEAHWSDVKPPVIAELWAPFFREEKDVFSLLFFADRGRISINGREVRGEVFQKDIWKPSIGGMRPSCVIAIGETIIHVG